MGCLGSAQSDQQQRVFLLRDHAGDSSYSSCLSAYFIRGICCLPSIHVLSRNLFDRSSTERTNPQGDLDDYTGQGELTLH